MLGTLWTIACCVAASCVIALLVFVLVVIIKETIKKIKKGESR